MDQPGRLARHHLEVEVAPADGAAPHRLWPSDRLWRWLGGGTVAAFAVSLLIHTLGGFASVFILVGGSAGGGGAGRGEGPGSVEMAVVTEGELAALEEAAAPTGMPLVPEVVAGTAMDEDPAETTIGGSFGPGEGVSDLGSDSIGGGDISGGGGGNGLGLGGSGGGGGASFFGIEAQGSRFAYIVDVSGSMSVEGRLESLKRELTKSVEGLMENASFFIVLFSGDAQLLGGRREWSDATDPNKRWARRTIARIAAQGETNPLPAFRVVLSTKPRPDAIYFMTDGDFGAQSDLVVLEIAALNSEARTPIHCICFVQRDSEAVMKRIARESGGTYTFIAGPHP
ncbi:MAG: hypothetical protein IT436_06945 [Phycisphaerales bacterium]|nr:hypothetical protein [Phycisphaerales bacterium]